MSASEILSAEKRHLAQLLEALQRIAEHFNTLFDLKPGLLAASGAFVLLCQDRLAINPTTEDFAQEFWLIVGVPE